MTATVASLAALCGALLLQGAAAAANPAPTATPADKAYDALAHDIYKQLIEINTTDSGGNVTTAAEAMAKRFLEAGFPAADVFVGGPTDRKKNVVVRLHGTGRHRPVLLIGHLDVVEARRGARTGVPIPSSSSRRTGSSTVAVPWI